MARYAEITLRYTIKTNVPYAKLHEWMSRLHHVTGRRMTRVVTSQATLRTWSDEA